MTIQQFEIWHAALILALQVAAFVVTIVAIQDRRQKRLYTLITEGDDKAREAAREQIEAVSQNVKALDQRVGELEKEVAAMPTREQIDANFRAIRDAIQQSNETMTARMDRVIEHVTMRPPGE